jgi:NADPH-dependent ferric siderophore reductase
MRTYTVRRHRPGEIDVDFVLHADGGPASRWAASARIGDPVAIYGPVSAYAPPEGCSFQLLVGDETAVPAIGAIVEQLPAGVRAEVLVAGDEQDWSTAGSVRVRWLPPELLCDAVSTVDVPASSTKYAWVAGEQSLVRAIRAILVDHRGFDRDQVYFSGYWCRGKSENED